MLIGRKFWLKHQLKMDLFNSRGTLLVNGEFISGSIGLDKQNPRLELVRALIEDADVDGVIRDLDLSEFHDDGKLQAALREILWYHRHIFKGVGCVNGYEHKIRLKEGAEPVAIPIRRRSPAEEAAEKEMVLKLVGQGVLEKAESPWAAVNVFVAKKDGGTRATSDFRAVNDRIVSDTYPMEAVRETLDWLSSKKVFSTFDLKDGYFQVKLAEESRAITAIRTVLGLYQYCRLPMGMKNSSAAFQRIVNLVLGDLKGRSVWAYMDDGSVGTITAEEHLKELDTVLSKMEKGGMKLKLTKCKFGVRRVEMLGHQVIPEGLLPSEGHVSAIKKLREPQNGTQLLRFIGLATYFADFIGGFAERMRPLNELLKGSGFNKKKYRGQTFHINDWELKWGDKQRDAWQDVRGELSNPVILAAPDASRKKKLMTDASEYGIGGVLLQKNVDEKWQPIAFTSRKLKGAETRYTVTEKECLAVVDALKKWRHYLHGIPRFLAVTDHEALKWLMNLKEPRGRLARWWWRYSAMTSK